MGETMKREELVLNLILVAMAVLVLAVAAITIINTGFRAGTDDLFLTLVCLLLALLFSINPILWARREGWLRNPFRDVVDEGGIMAAVDEHATGRRTYVYVWLALLGLTFFEVFLAYIHVPVHMMLVILMGASIIKAALIMAYFMHLKFERLSLILTLVPAMVICILLLMIIFPDSFRLLRLRV